MHFFGEKSVQSKSIPAWRLGCQSSCCRMNSGRDWNRSLPNDPARAGRGKIIAPCSKASCGYSRRARAGAICHRTLTSVPPPAGAGCGGGRSRTCGCGYGAGSRPTGPARPTRLERELHRRQLRGHQKGGDGVGKTKRGKGTKWMVVVDGQGVPLGNHLDRASPAEVTLVNQTLAQVRVPRSRWGRPKSKSQDSSLTWRTTAARCAVNCATGASNWSARTARTGAKRRRRMAAPCAATAAGGKSNAPSPGWATSVGWSFATNAPC